MHYWDKSNFTIVVIFLYLAVFSLLVLSGGSFESIFIYKAY